MRDKAVDTYPFVFDFLPDSYKTQVMCDKVISEEPLLLKYCLNRHKTQEMCDKTVDAILPTLKFAPDCFLRIKYLKNLMIL